MVHRSGTSASLRNVLAIPYSGRCTKIKPAVACLHDEFSGADDAEPWPGLVPELGRGLVDPDGQVLVGDGADVGHQVGHGLLVGRAQHQVVTVTVPHPGRTKTITCLFPRALQLHIDNFVLWPLSWVQYTYDPQAFIKQRVTFSVSLREKNADAIFYHPH